MIVTIDGPAGAGKSSAAKRLAERLGFHFLDTGAMYRCVTLAAMQSGVDLEDADALLKVAQAITIELDDDRVRVDGQDVTHAIRSTEVTSASRHAANHPGVRARLVELQRQVATGRDVVTEGRDQSTVVFPNAECKVYLTASEEVRAERRRLDLLGRGERVTLEEVLKDQRARDQRDSSREVGALLKADDAVEVATDGMSPGEVEEKLLEVVNERKSGAAAPDSPQP